MNKSKNYYDVEEEDFFLDGRIGLTGKEYTSVSSKLTMTNWYFATVLLHKRPSLLVCDCFCVIGEMKMFYSWFRIFVLLIIVGERMGGWITYGIESSIKERKLLIVTAYTTHNFDWNRVFCDSSYVCLMTILCCLLACRTIRSLVKNRHSLNNISLDLIM